MHDKDYEGVLTSGTDACPQENDIGGMDLLRCLTCGKRTSRVGARQRLLWPGRCGYCEGGVLLLDKYGPTLLVGPRKAAEIAGVHENTIRNWRISGRLPVGWVMPSGFARFRAEDVAYAAIYPYHFAAIDDGGGG
jgi:hypothetical protein